MDFVPLTIITTGAARVINPEEIVFRNNGPL
jgi:hypothetical protein